jgi:NADH dehydrogenase [ubiquinone] 1 alpha subcomplex assembly factor 7
MTQQNALGQRIARMIAAQGPMSIAQFMTLALHDPRDGYYATRDPLGADFITAPEISQAFGELLGLWCAKAWHDQGKPRPARLVELGPGRGTLMADALRAARLMPEFLDAIEVVLVETSPVLAAAQKDALKDCKHPLRWVQSATELAHDRPQFTIANEFLDALPIQQFVMTGKGWSERMVGVDASGALTFMLAPVAWNFSVPPERGEAAPGAVYEFSSAAIALVEDIARGIAHTGGAALFIDYGYKGFGFGETLQTVGDNKYKAILDTPGAVDISAHVDFGAMARAAAAGGAKTYGPIGQGEFLANLGIREREASLRRIGQGGMSLAIERLTDAEEMGTLFKALAILPASAPVPSGFE